MTLKVYLDMASQPCRAVVMYMNLSGIPFEEVLIAIRRGEHKKESYLKINPLGKVPTLVDGNFILTESVAIYRYLARKYSVPDYLYPKDVQKQARVDEYLEWQHLNTRLKAGTVFMREVIFNQDSTAAVAEMNAMLNDLEMMFLKNKPYLTGDELSVADIVAACELMQVTISGRDIFAGHPTLKQWIERVKKETQPYFHQAHQIVFQITKQLAKKSRM